MTETIASDASEASATVLVPEPPAPAGEPAPSAVPAPVEYRFEFRGDEREYFRIWIVNLALAIVTLGIWSAWAKVRTMRYFYANTRVAGTPFEYLARPLPILRGRLIAFSLFTAYLLASRFSPTLQLALIVLIVTLSPWLIVRGLMFRARYSSWRGLNFRFVPQYGAAYTHFLFVYLLFPLTLGFIFPYVKWRQKKFVVEQHRFGGRAFTFSAEASEFYKVYFIAIGLVIGAWIALFSILIPLTARAGASTIGMYATLAVIYAVYFAVFVYIASRILNLTYNNAALDGFRLRSSVRARDLLRLYFFNTCGILLSLGMLIPWAMIRMARYRASRLMLVADGGDLDALTVEEQGHVSAVGAEVDQVFDLDVGL
jgi:uncharacterized membrane protein YjgN (DUF898 family)